MKESTGICSYMLGVVKYDDFPQQVAPHWNRRISQVALGALVAGLDCKSDGCWTWDVGLSWITWMEW